jgi:hypothetical protein
MYHLIGPGTHYFHIDSSTPTILLALVQITFILALLQITFILVLEPINVVFNRVHLTCIKGTIYITLI